jgi:magnesium-transporting ATPase (P-type)
MTLNLVLCTSVLLIGTTLGSSPFKVIHLLWANLVMDVLGAIALGTEPPNDSVRKENSAEVPNSQANRVSRKDKIIIPSMWRTIFTQATYQLLVIIILQYFGTLMFFDDSYNIVTEYDEVDSGHVVNTMIFHTFMLMNLVNMINCRVVIEDEKNVFKTLFNNLTFWAILGIELFIQVMFIYGSLAFGPTAQAIFGCAQLNFAQRMTCWGLAIGPLIIFPLSKMIPMRFFEHPKVKNFLKLEVSRDESALSQFKDSAQTKVKGRASKLIDLKGVQPGAGSSPLLSSLNYSTVDYNPAPEPESDGEESDASNPSGAGYQNNFAGPGGADNEQDV